MLPVVCPSSGNRKVSIPHEVRLYEQHNRIEGGLKNLKPYRAAGILLRKNCA